MEAVLVALAAAGGGSSFFRLVPQAWRAWRTSVRGVDGAAWSLNAVSLAGWTAIGVQEDATLLAASALLDMALSLVIAAAVVRDGGWRHAQPARTAALLALVGVVTALGNGVTLAVLLAVYDLAVLALSWREVRRSSDVGGVSVLGWVLNGTSELCWTVYAVLLGAWAVAGPSVLWAVGCLALAAAARTKQHATPVTAAAVGTVG